MKDELFEELVASLKEAGSIMREETPALRSLVVSPLDIKNIREGYDLTQNQFAGCLAFAFGSCVTGSKASASLKGRHMFSSKWRHNIQACCWML